MKFFKFNSLFLEFPNMSKNVIIDAESLIDESIFELLGLTDAPKDKKDQIMDDMIVTVQNRVLARILDILESKNDELIEAYKQLIEKDDSEKSRDFLAKEDIDLDQLIAEEALNYKMQIVNFVQQTV